MSRRKSLIYGITVYVLTCVLIIVGALCTNEYSYDSSFKIFGLFIASGIIFGLINAFWHEAGHIIMGKKNNFEILALTVWFFKWVKVNGRFEFSFCMMGDEAGYTDSVPKSGENMDKRVRKMSFGGPLFSLIALIVSIVPYFFVGKLPLVVFCLLAMSLPVSFFYFAWNIIPIVSDGIFNDGAVMYSVKKKTNTSVVMLSLLKIQAELFNGKTPAEIDKSLYFDLPQLAEDDLYFALILNARYNYYLDMQDYENALKTQKRLEDIEDYLPKNIITLTKVDSLYNSCALKKDGEKADELMYELEKFLNNVNTVTNVRVKLAYLLLVDADKEQIELFYKKGVKEAKKCQLSGLGKFEKKLLDGLIA